MIFLNSLEPDYIFILICFLGSLAQQVYSLVANKGDFSTSLKTTSLRLQGEIEGTGGGGGRGDPPFCTWIWYQPCASLPPRHEITELNHIPSAVFHSV